MESHLSPTSFLSACLPWHSPNLPFHSAPVPNAESNTSFRCSAAIPDAACIAIPEPPAPNIVDTYYLSLLEQACFVLPANHSSRVAHSTDPETVKTTINVTPALDFDNEHEVTVRRISEYGIRCASYPACPKQSPDEKISIFLKRLVTVMLHDTLKSLVRRKVLRPPSTAEKR